MEVRDLIVGEARLTVGLLAGALTGELLMRLRLTEVIFKPIKTRLEAWGINQHALSAMAVALASPRVGAAMLASAHREGKITKDGAVFGTLCLAFPSYIKRWLATAPVAIATAGTLGLAYSVVLIARSAARFLLCLSLLRRKNSKSPDTEGNPTLGDINPPRWAGSGAPVLQSPSLRVILRSLPMAWAFFAITFFLMPRIESTALRLLGGAISPSALAVVTSALAHSAAALASAKGALSAGSISPSGALLALLVGNCLATFTRVLRQNMGYWVGIFPPGVLRPLAIWHLGTLLLFEALSLTVVALWWWL